MTKYSPIRKGIIYCATNLTNSKTYVGQTIHDLSVRKKEHESSAKRKDGFLFHRAINKYGKENFKWEILYEGVCLNRAEQFFICLLKSADSLSGYNLTKGGNYSCVWSVESDEQKIEHRRKISETKHIRNSSKGSKNPMFGKGYKIVGGKNGRARKTMCIETKEIFPCLLDLANRLSINGNPVTKRRKLDKIIKNNLEINEYHYRYL